MTLPNGLILDNTEELPCESGGERRFVCPWEDRINIAYALMGCFAEVEISGYGAFKGAVDGWEKVVITAKKPNA